MRFLVGSIVVAAGAVALLAGCDAAGPGDGVGGVSPEEARSLNEAAAMLDDRADKARSAVPAARN